MGVASGRRCYGHYVINMKCMLDQEAGNAGSTSNKLSDADIAAMQLRTVTHNS